MVPLDSIIDRLEEVEERAGERPGSDHLLSVLVHVHGPRLEEAGPIEYDVRSRGIRYDPDERVERFLEAIDEATGAQ